MNAFSLRTSTAGRLFFALFILLFLVANSAICADYPSKPIKIVIPFKAGGSPPNVFARTIADHLKEVWDQPAVVENRPGAGGQIATQYVAGQKADGHTLMIGSVATHAIKKAWDPKLPVDTLSFEPISQLGFTPMLISVNPKLGVKTLDELIAKAKAEPDTITFASVGKGSAAHLASELLQDAAGIKLIHVPYPGIAKAKLDIISGEVNVGFSNIISMYQFIEDGSIIPLAITDTERSPILPDVPTLSEKYPGISVELWWGVFAPAGTPKDVVEKLNKEINVVLSNPEMIETWKKQATTIKGSTPEELKALLDKDYQKWLELINKKGLNK